MNPPTTPPSVFVARRKALLDRLPVPALIAAGFPRPRNYAGNTYPFRATSHFLYFVGRPLPGAALLFANGRALLFVEPTSRDAALWNGPSPTLLELREELQVDDVLPLSELPAHLAKLGQVGTIPTQDAASSAWLSAVLGRTVVANSGPSVDPSSADGAVIQALIALRQKHDPAALEQIRAAAQATAEAHLAGMRATPSARFEYEVAAAMLGELRRHHMVDSYLPIVSVHGEVLHNETHDNPLRPGDLLLADVGGETPEGWAADITRVWPVSGRFSPTQRAIYDLVLALQKEAVAQVRKGVRYRRIHEQAGRRLLQGLRDLGIVKGDLDGLYERGAHALFFPHGVGHLLGLDVHDMEDLGDRAAYAPGRTRSARFGDKSLRLDLDLEPGMAVTIEPGFYQVPAILNDPELTAPLGADLDREVLARFADVRGIRIEDDVVCTEGEPEVLTAGVPKDPEAIEAVMAAAR